MPPQDNRPSLLVTGATGAVGRAAVDALVARDVPVLACSRTPGRAALPAAARPVRFAWEDDTTWGPALADVSGVALVLPQDLLRVGRTVLPFLHRAVAAGVRHVAFVSIVDADQVPGFPAQRVERALARLGVAWTSLRPNMFWQALTDVHAAALATGELRLPAGGGRTAGVDARDVGEALALIMLEPERHAGRTYTLTGTTAVDYAEVAAAVARHGGTPLTYRSTDPCRYWTEHRRAGQSRFLVASSIAAYASVRLGRLDRVTDDLPELLGRPPRTVEDYARDHAAALAA